MSLTKMVEADPQDSLSTLRGLDCTTARAAGMDVSAVWFNKYAPSTIMAILERIGGGLITDPIARATAARWKHNEHRAGDEFSRLQTATEPDR